MGRLRLLRKVKDGLPLSLEEIGHPGRGGGGKRETTESSVTQALETESDIIWLF